MKELPHTISHSRQGGTFANVRIATASFALFGELRRQTTNVLVLAFVLTTGTELAAKIPAGDPIVGQDENLLVNGNFQSKDGKFRPLRWRIISNRTATGLDALVTREYRIESEFTYPPPAGQESDPAGASLKMMDNSTTDDVVLRSEKRLAIPGMVYDAGARVLENSGTAAKLYLEFWDADNNLTETASGALTASGEPGYLANWKVASVNATAPSNALHVTVSIRSAVASTGISYWDNAFLKAQAPYNPALTTSVREFFFDDYRLESSWDVERRLMPPTKSVKLISKDKNWESDALAMTGTVLKDAGGPGYQMWYYSNGRTLYATSSDGTTWTKPSLGSYTYGSGTNNNIAFPPGQGRITVVYVPAPVEPDPNKRYKALVHAGPNSGYYYWYSPTGTSGWTIGNGGNPVLPYGNLSNVTYDAANGRYVATTRQRTLNAGTAATFTGDRTAFVSVSTDFVNWKAPAYPVPASAPEFSPAAEGDQADDFAAQARRRIEAHVDAMPVYPYGSVYIAFPTIFEQKNFVPGTAADVRTGSTFPQIASSRDLRVWHRPNRSPIIPLSRSGGWDAGSIQVASTMVEDNGQVYVYYSGANLEWGAAVPNPKTLKSSIARAQWTKDRLVAISNRAGNVALPGVTPLVIKDEGFVKTKTITFTGATTLKVNTNIGANGRLRVEILDAATDLPKTGFSFSDGVSVAPGDKPNHTISWTGGSNISSLAGQSIKLKFYVRNADLFSYWVE